MSDARSAPSADRIAISLMRTAARASSRFATFAHAMSSTKPTAPSSTSSAGRMRPDDRSSSERTLSVHVGAKVVRVRRLQILGERRHLGLRALERDAGLEPRREIQVLVRVAAGERRRLERERHEQIGLAGEEAREALRHHADDLIRLAIQLDRLSDRARLAGKEPRPHAVAQHDDVLLARVVVVAAERAAEHRRHAEHVKPVAGDAHARYALGVAGAGEVRAELRLDGDRLEALRLVAVVAEAARRHRRLHVVERRIEVLDRHQPRGYAVRQRPEQHGVDDAEDRRVRANAERERERRRSR